MRAAVASMIECSKGGLAAKEPDSIGGSAKKEPREPKGWSTSKKPDANAGR